MINSENNTKSSLSSLVIKSIYEFSSEDLKETESND